MANGLFETNAALRNVQARAQVSIARARQQTVFARRSLAVAAASSRGTDVQSMTKAAIAARDAYQASIGAEAEKHRATFLLLSADARKTAANTLYAAQNVKNARDRRVTIERATNDGRRADVLEEAAERAYVAAKDVPEPEVVSQRRVQRLATAQGIDLSKDPAHHAVSVNSMLPLNRKMVNPLANWIYPAGIQQAAAALGGLGEAESGPSFIDAVKRAIGAGVASASGEAFKAGQAATGKDPGAAVALSTSGSLLDAIARTLGVGAVEQPVTEERKFPWGAVLTVAAVGGVGVLAWRAFR